MPCFSFCSPCLKFLPSLFIYIIRRAIDLLCLARPFTAAVHLLLRPRLQFFHCKQCYFTSFPSDDFLITAAVTFTFKEMPINLTFEGMAVKNTVHWIPKNSSRAVPFDANFDVLSHAFYLFCRAFGNTLFFRMCLAMLIQNSLNFHFGAVPWHANDGGRAFDYFQYALHSAISNEYNTSLKMSTAEGHGHNNTTKRGSHTDLDGRASTLLRPLRCAIYSLFYLRLCNKKDISRS